MINQTIQKRLTLLERQLQHKTRRIGGLDDFYRDVVTGSSPLELHYSATLKPCAHMCAHGPRLG